MVVYKTGSILVCTVKNIRFWMISSLIFLAAFYAHADSVTYTLENVILDDSTQMTGSFLWTYNTGNFENGAGQFTSLNIPHTSNNPARPTIFSKNFPPTSSVRRFEFLFRVGNLLGYLVA